MRIRVGNIQIGDPHILDSFYRENRFNSYMAGEIHVVSPDLIPNGRRDDFVDNTAKNLLHRAFEYTVGIPASKEIRRRSRNQSEVKSIKNDKNIVSESRNQNVGEHITNSIKINPIEMNNCLEELANNTDFLKELIEKCQGCQVFQEVLDKYR